MKTKDKKYIRKRPIIVNFRVSKEEHLKLTALLLLSGKKKNQFLIDAILNSRPEIIGGKFASFRLSQEIRKLRESLETLNVTDELKDLLLRCREIVSQLISLLK